VCGLSGAAQEVTGSIVGTVTDASGAVVPGAKVTVLNEGTRVVRELSTDELGNYLATLLPIGVYTVSVEKQGFKKASHTKIELNVNDKLTHNFALEVGSVAETVVVEASPLQVELQTTASTGLIDGTQVRELSLNNRNYLQLITLMPGVSSGASDQLYIGTTNPAGQTNVVSFSINGNRNSANSYTVDGADNVDRGSNLTLLNYPSVDAIAEFKVLRGLYSAEFGRAAASQINVITRSGTSQFHGGAYEFFRNDKIAANTFFNNARRIARPPLRYNNFGYTIGGPVFFGEYNRGRDKTFFFWSHEFRRTRIPATLQALVPTNDEKQGIFTSPVCVAASGSTCASSTTRITNINPIAQAYIRDIFSKISGDARTLFHAASSKYDHRQELIRIDHVFGPKLAVSGRFLNDTIPTVEPGGLFTGSALPGVSTTATDSPGRGVTLRATSTLSPTWLLESGYAFSYGAIISRILGTVGAENSPNIKVALPFPSTLGRVPALNFGGALSTVTGFGPYDDFNRNHNFYANLTKVLGRHALKFGATFHHYQKNENAGGNNAGTFTFSTTGFDTGPRPAGTTTAQQAWANFLMGRAATFTQASLDLFPDIQTWQWEAYLQDDFRMRPNLTINMGVRYSAFRTPHDAKGMLTNFDPARWNAANAPQINPANGTLVAGTGDPLNGIVINGKGPYGDKVSNEANLNFAPRIGFTWDPFSTGRTAVRAGYGIAYDAPLFGIYEQNIFANPPFVQSITISNTQMDNITGGTTVVSAAPLTLRGTPDKFQQPYSQQWSFGIQREVTKGLITEVSYFGTKGTHLLGIVDINQVPVGLAYTSGLLPAGTTISAGTVTARLNAIRPYRGYGPINVIRTWFNSNYNALQVSVQKRFAGNSSFNLAYTWSKNLTDNQSDRSNAAQNTYDRRSEYSVAFLDRTHVLTFNYVYHLPWFKEQNGLVGRLLGGWQISGISTFNTGVPLTVTSSGVDPGALGFLGTSAAGGRPDRVGDPNANAPHTIAQWFNTSAFALVPAGQVRPGNAGRGVVRGPGHQRWDFSVFKNIKTTEAIRLQFRAEMFNIFNHTNPLGVGTAFGTTTFGQITSTRDPRIVQFGLKLNF
jgi:hypothetical protein